MNFLIDDHGRRIRKLRISLTDRCNLRCHYCMPVDQSFMDETRYLDTNQICEIVANLCERGLEEVRLTGGEPLLRRSFDEIVQRIAQLPLKKIGLTTNGVLLDRHFEILLKSGVRHLNISLDSLNESNFAKITHGVQFKRVMSNILEAKRLGFEIKINFVAMKGVNDHEILDLVDWSEKNAIEVRFLELMRIGYANQNQKTQFISADEIMDKIKCHHVLESTSAAHDSTSFNFTTSRGARIGFIASESRAFCGACSRWRLSADGILRSCLLKEDGISITRKNQMEQNEIFNQVLKMKPGLRPAEVSHVMNQIGG